MCFKGFTHIPTVFTYTYEHWTQTKKKKKDVLNTLIHSITVRVKF